jgi:hypothetical protein
MRRSPYLLLLLLLVLSQCAPGFSFMNHQGHSKDASYTTSIMHQSDPSKEEASSSSSEPSCSERRQLFSTVASSFAALGGGFLLGASPATAAAPDLSGMSGMFSNGVTGKKNKKIGGLANKIRGVCSNMVRRGLVRARLISLRHSTWNAASFFSPTYTRLHLSIIIKKTG